MEYLEEKSNPFVFILSTFLRFGPEKETTTWTSHELETEVFWLFNTLCDLHVLMVYLASKAVISLI